MTSRRSIERSHDGVGGGPSRQSFVSIDQSHNLNPASYTRLKIDSGIKELPYGD